MTDSADVAGAAVLGDVLTVPVAVLGETLVVRPLEIRQIPPFTRLIRMAAPSLMRLYAAKGQSDGSFESAFLDLIADHGEAVVAACAVAIGRDAEWLEQGSIDELLSVIIAVAEVNQDFFAKRVAPMLSKLAASPVGSVVANGDGTMPSSS